MNINIIKEEIKSKLNKKVLISVYGMRNRVNRLEGILYKSYPNLSISLGNYDKKLPVPALGSIIQSNCEKLTKFKHYFTIGRGV